MGKLGGRDLMFHLSFVPLILNILWLHCILHNKLTFANCAQI